MSHISNDLYRQVTAQMSGPIAIDDDDDDEVQEIPRPAQRRSTETPGMFVTPNLGEPLERYSNDRWTVDRTAEPEQRRSTQTPEMFVTPNPGEPVERYSNDSQTIDLTEEPELGPPGRRCSRGISDSDGLFVRQSHSENNNSTPPVSRDLSVHVDLTLLDDEEETDGPEQTAHDHSSHKEEDGVDKKPSHTPASLEEPRGFKRPRSSSTAASEPANNPKRQMIDARLTSQSQ